jgi:hypothetical protein
MREALNSNPMAQAAVIAVLLLAVAFFAITTMGGGAEEEPAPAAGEAAPETVVATPEGTAPTAATASVAPAPGAIAETAPPPPARVAAAIEANQIVVLLFVRNGGIDDRMVADVVRGLSSLSGVPSFVVPADQIARYAAITQSADVDRVPALVVVRPKRLGNGTPSATVSYGFQTAQSVVQAVVDAGYKGPTLDYHP